MNTSNTISNIATTHSFNALLTKVFIWMAAGMFITAVISYIFATTPSLFSLLVNTDGITGLGYVLMFAPIGFVLLMSFQFNRLSYAALLILFLLYAATMGASLSFIFLIYTSKSIFIAIIW